MFHKKLVVLAFDSRLRAAQAHLALTRLAERNRLILHDAVFVTRNDNTSAFIEDIVDDRAEAVRGAMGVEFWNAFFHTVLAQPFAQAVTTGLASASLQELRDACGKDSCSLALLVSDVDPLAVVVELERFHDARVVIANVPGRALESFRPVMPRELQQEQA